MTKLNWNRPRRVTLTDRPLYEAGEQWLKLHGGETHTKPKRTLKPRMSSADEEITIIQGADSPGNKTGERIVHVFPNLKAAHKAGFNWAI